MKKKILIWLCTFIWLILCIALSSCSPCRVADYVRGQIDGPILAEGTSSAFSILGSRLTEHENPSEKDAIEDALEGIDVKRYSGLRVVHSQFYIPLFLNSETITAYLYGDGRIP